nr:hypothetical protein Itr_chr07CG08850 [Ipomoea trifida]
MAECGQNLQQPRSPFSVADGRVGGEVIQLTSPSALLCYVRGSKPRSCGGGCAEKPAVCSLPCSSSRGGSRPPPLLPLGSDRIVGDDLHDGSWIGRRQSIVQ